MDIAEITENFALLDDWEDRYRYLIELGRLMPPFPEAERTDDNKVQGCTSQVWLSMKVEPTPEPTLVFVGDSDAHIVRGLVAILIALFSGKTAREIVATDALATFDAFGLRAHLTPQRSNGLHAMIERIRHEARAALAAA